MAVVARSRRLLYYYSHALLHYASNTTSCMLYRIQYPFLGTYALLTNPVGLPVCCPLIIVCLVQPFTLSLCFTFTISWTTIRIGRIKELINNFLPDRLDQLLSRSRCPQDMCIRRVLLAHFIYQRLFRFLLMYSIYMQMIKTSLCVEIVLLKHWSTYTCVVHIEWYRWRVCIRHFFIRMLSRYSYLQYRVQKCLHT